MSCSLKYMPVFRLKQEEKTVLHSFDFGECIYPCVEIIKEMDRKIPTMRKGVLLPLKKKKSFAEIHLPILRNIRAKKIFLDLPIHMTVTKNSNADVLSFISTIRRDRKKRTEYILQLTQLAKSIIPVVFTYSQITGEMNSIRLQEKDLRPYFSQLCFRTIWKTFFSDMGQIMAVAQPQDFLIVDLQEEPADPTDEDILDIIDRLENFTKCHIIILRSAIRESISNVGLTHGKKVPEADNHLINTYAKLQGKSFGDYAGIKKGSGNEGGTISPGFLFYDAIENSYYGFKGSTNAAGKTNGEISDFETIIVPAVKSCAATTRMKSSRYPYLSPLNEGWRLIEDIFDKKENGRHQGKFKRISMLHYLHCIRTKIETGELK